MNEPEPTVADPNVLAERLDGVVIGAGQAGLAIGRFPAQQRRRFVILEAAEAVGAARRDRWHSLVLFTSRRYDGLPDLPFPGEPDGYPTRDEVVRSFEQYAATFALPIPSTSPVRSLTVEGGTFVLRLDDCRIEAAQVVGATGPFQAPNVPAHYFLGRSLQHTKGSALLGWVKDEAAFIADRVEAVAERRPVPASKSATADAAAPPQAAGALQGA